MSEISRKVVLQPNGNFLVDLARLYAEAFVIDLVSGTHGDIENRCAHFCSLEHFQIWHCMRSSYREKGLKFVAENAQGWKSARIIFCILYDHFNPFQSKNLLHTTKHGCLTWLWDYAHISKYPKRLRTKDKIKS